ncbi:MAG: hypothetical protein FJX75_23735 [Armatimonadetes bacterium]|nr:hypothetical protein [Armatimonadota bacterium]
MRVLGVVTLTIGGLLTMGLTASAQRFVQDRFVIGFWVDPPADERMDERYREVAEANFTLFLGANASRTPETMRQCLALCEKYGMAALLWTGGLPPDRLPEGPTCWGYALRDEPSVKDFPALREAVDALRKARPGKLTYINLFPNYANQQQLGTETYEEHVARFMEEVDPDVLSMDHYPVMKPNGDSRASYCANLEVMRTYALQKGVPFWNFFNTMPFGPHLDPTEADLRWQIFTSLAYGAKGVLYFCYWTPTGGEFPKGGAIITAEGRKTRHYEQAKRINAAVRNLGPTLMQLTSTGVYRVKPEDDPAQVLADTPIKRTECECRDYLVGVFTHADGRRAVLLNNYSNHYTSWPTVDFDVDASQVIEVSQETGEETPVIDDSPAMEGLQLSLDAGQGRLFLLPAK